MHVVVELVGGLQVGRVSVDVGLVIELEVENGLRVVEIEVQLLNVFAVVLVDFLDFQGFPLILEVLVHTLSRVLVLLLPNDGVLLRVVVLFEALEEVLVVVVLSQSFGPLGAIQGILQSGVDSVELLLEVQVNRLVEEVLFQKSSLLVQLGFDRVHLLRKEVFFVEFQ